jgi:hypothetical protein
MVMKKCLKVNGFSKFFKPAEKAFDRRIIQRRPFSRHALLQNLGMFRRCSGGNAEYVDEDFEQTIEEIYKQNI